MRRGGKTGVLGEKSLGVRRESTNYITQPTHDAHSGNETWAHWWRASAFTTAPLFQPWNDVGVARPFARRVSKFAIILLEWLN